MMQVDQVLMEAKGHNGQLELLPDRVRIQRKGMLSKLGNRFQGEKEIRTSQISSIQYRRATGLVNGHIRFVFLGGSEKKGGTFSATKDDDAVVYRKSQQGAFDAIKAAIDQQVRASHSPVTTGAPPASDLDDLERLAGLREKGIITDDEFEAKKSQILSI